MGDPVYVEVGWLLGYFTGRLAVFRFASGRWPTKTTAPRKDYVGSEACMRWHADKFEGQKNMPMAHALTLGTSSAFEELSRTSHWF